MRRETIREIIYIIIPAVLRPKYSLLFRICNPKPDGRGFVIPHLSRHPLGLEICKGLSCEK